MLSAQLQNSEPVHLLFVGGCHTTGYALGNEYAFPLLTSQILAREGLDVHVDVLPGMKLSHHRRLARKFNEVKPDVVILQLGHAELNYGLEDYLRRLVGRQVAHAEPGTGSTMVQNPWAFQFKNLFKLALNFCLGHPLVDFNKFTALWRSMLERTQKLGAAHVVVLSPLACADPTALYYRTRALSICRELSAEYHCEFVDVLSQAPRTIPPHFGTQEHYFDGLHLAGGGQLALADRLVTHLRPLIASVEKCIR